MSLRETKKQRLDTEERSVASNGSRAPAAGNSLSFTTGKRFDAWQHANETASKVDGVSRVSHFIYSVQVNPNPPARLLKPGMAYLVALVTAEHLMIVQVSEKGDTVERMELFVVPDQPCKDQPKQAKQAAEKEDLYTCIWVKDPINRQEWTAVCFAGSTGVIRIVDLALMPQRTAFLRGHATAVNELRYCPTHPAFLLSCSKDQTMRLWSIKYLQCLAVFGGAQGHKAEIISMDVDSTGSYLVSGSYDSCIKIWALFGDENKRLMDAVRIHAITSDPQSVTVPAPLFSASDIHDGQIDCVRFAFPGTKNIFVISKASDQTILIWLAILSTGPRLPGITAEWQQCHRIKLTHNEFWFVKFSLLQGSPAAEHLFALGDDKGSIKIMDLEALVKKEKHATAFVKATQHRHGSPNKAVIRSVDFSSDGRLLVGGSDDGLCHIFVRKEFSAPLKFVASASAVSRKGAVEDDHSNSV
ncbi:putative Polycomb protein EED [Hypsibius exemplaris]|uniref:Polycomb protein EED n=1 Tax=Hypsibius exemplaris TaxID=2072580 RepID=A0A9X6NCR7_HYPEX|nr:putative Polycomb protein EED [Hypsibius exemplaris]